MDFLNKTKVFTLHRRSSGLASRYGVAGFTLVELLIVIGILAVLATTAVMVLNPAQFLAQSRDADRLTDLRTLEKAVSLSVTMGGATDNTQSGLVYLSLPDTNGDDRCTEYTTLPPLSGGWEYRCMADATTLKDIDGSGWLPIDFTSSSDIDPPLAALPVDPGNSETNYYAYTQGVGVGEYSLFAAMESQKYEAMEENDGGSSSDYYETAPVAFTPSIDWTVVGYGSETVFDPTSTTIPYAAKIDSTHFVAVVHDTQTRATIGTISGNTVSFGSNYVFNPAFTQWASVAVLDATHFVVAYTDVGNGSYGTAIIGTISGNTISFGSEYVFNSVTSQYPSVVKMDASHFVVSYRDAGNSGYGTAIVGTVSGNTIAYGSEYVFHPADISTSLRAISATPLSASTFVVTYADESSSRYGTAAVGTVSGNTISFGSEYVFNTAWSSDIFATTIDASRFIVGYRDLGVSGRGNSIIGTVTGNTISFGSEYAFNMGSTSEASIDKLDATHIVISYRDGGNADNGTATIGTVTGNTVAYGNEYIFNPAATYQTSVVATDASHFVAVYRDGGNGSYATGIVGFPQ